MKLGIIIDDLTSIAPTVANFEQGILTSLNKLSTKHEIIILTFGDVKNNNKLKKYKFRFININDFNVKIRFLKPRLMLTNFTRILLKELKLDSKFKIKDVMDGLKPLDRALKSETIQFVWQPFCMHLIDVPYMTNCMDVNYRINPFLPEERIKAPYWDAYNLLRINFMQRATYVITSTTSGKNELMKYFNIAEDRIRKIPFFTPKVEEVDFTDHKLSSVAWDKLPQKFLFYPSRIVAQKNHITILYALKFLKDEHNINIDFIFVGQNKGNLTYIKEKTTELQLTETVHYLGSVSYQDIDMLYRKAFALVYASINGPDNLPPLEAFDKGCPVIATNLSGSEEQFGDCALLFEKMDHKELALQILKLLNDDDLRKSLISKGLVRAKSFTADDYLREAMLVVDEFEPYSRLWNGVNY